MARTDARSWPLNITTEVIEQALLRLYENADEGEEKVLGERALQQLWASTGLRNDDLVTGVNRLLESGCLASEYGDGERRLRLINDTTRAGAAGETSTSWSVSSVLSRAALRPRRPADTPGQRSRVQDRSHLRAVPPTFEPRHNRLLASLPSPVRERLTTYLELIPMAASRSFFRPDDDLRYAYFPIDAIMSQVHVAADGTTAEVAIIGNEGLVGLALLTGADEMVNHSIVRSSGCAYRIEADSLREEFGRDPSLQGSILRYAQAQITQSAWTAACSHRHTLDQQFSRLLLMLMDRLPSNQLVITHQEMADMLGVRREGVSAAALKLKRSGAIEYGRGQLTIVERHRLERSACGCHAVIAQEFDRLLKPPTAY